jgi:hypothetical protein
MKTELESTKITNGFITPINYFETFSNEIIGKINGEATSTSIPKTLGFIVPEDFFVLNEAKLLTNIKNPESKVINLKSVFYKVSRIAAVILLTIIGSISYNTAETKNNESTEMSYLEMHSEEISVYEVGALLDNKEIIELENELIYNNLNNIN